MKRRMQKILEILKKSEKPIKGRELARKLGVSRQLIVQYISQLKADGHSIISTREGYILEKEKNTFRKMIAVKHKADEIEEELMTIVNSGGRVLDDILNSLGVKHKPVKRVVAGSGRRLKDFSDAGLIDEDTVVIDTDKVSLWKLMMGLFNSADSYVVAPGVINIVASGTGEYAVIIENEEDRIMLGLG